MEAVGSLIMVIVIRDDDIVQRIQLSVFVVGELNPKDLKETMVSPNTRTLMQYTMEDETMVNEVFSKLMGNDSMPRKKFLENDEL